MSLDEPLSTAATERVRLADIRGNPRNPKEHASDVIASSVRRFGWVEPVVVDRRTGMLVSGHGRVEALRDMRDGGESPPDGIDVDVDGEWLIPAVTNWASRSDAEAEAVILALNRTGEIGGWNDRTLADLLDGLSATAARFDGTGFNQGDLAVLLRQLDADARFGTDQSGAADEFLGIATVSGDGIGSVAYRQIRVVFADEVGCRDFFAKLGRKYDAECRSFGYPESIPRDPQMFDG